MLHPRGGVTVTGAVTRCRPVNFSGSTSTGGVGRSGFHFNSSVFRGFFSFDLCLFVEAWRGGGGVLVDVLVGVNPKPQTSNPKTQASNPEAPPRPSPSAPPGGRDTRSHTTRGHEGEQIPKSIIGLLPRKHAKSQQLITFPIAFRPKM